MFVRNVVKFLVIIDFLSDISEFILKRNYISFYVGKYLRCVLFLDNVRNFILDRNFINECGRIFFQREYLYRYQRIYMGKSYINILNVQKMSVRQLICFYIKNIWQKNYICNYCGKVFIDNLFFKKYEQICIGEQFQFCYYCGQIFSGVQI